MYKLMLCLIVFNIYILNTDLMGHKLEINNCMLPVYKNTVNIKSLGIKGNMTDEHDLLETLLNRGGSYIFKNINIIISSEIIIKNPVNLKLIFKNSKITIVNKKKNLRSFIYADSNVKHIEIQGGIFNGKNKAMSAFYFNCPYFIHDTKIFNISTNIEDNDLSSAIYSRFKLKNKNYCIDISNNKIYDISAESDDKLTNRIGASRAITIIWTSSKNAVIANIYDNTINHVYGEEGDAIHIFDHDVKKESNKISKIVILDNNISLSNRRFLKISANNVLIKGNIFNGYYYGYKEAINSTAMLSTIKGSSNIIISNNIFNNNGSHTQMISLNSSENIKIIKNIFNSRKNGAAKTTGISLEILGKSENIFFEKNIINTDADYQIVIKSNNTKNINIVDNLMYVNEGNHKFILFYYKNQRNIIIDSNIIDGDKGNAISKTFDSFMVVNSSSTLENVRVENNKIIDGQKRVTSGRFAKIWGKNPQLGLVFKNNYSESSKSKYSISNKQGIIFLDDNYQK